MIVQEFLREKDIKFDTNSENYNLFLRDIMLGEYRELTTIGSKYIHSTKELYAVTQYASTGIELLHGDQNRDLSVKIEEVSNESISKSWWIPYDWQ